MDNQDPKLRVISTLYDAVADVSEADAHDAYAPMFFAMDDVIEQVLQSAGKVDPAETLSPHFDRAAHIFDILSREETETPLTYVSQRNSATAVIDRSGRIIAVNTAFNDELDESLQPGANLTHCLANPADQNRFTALARANSTDGQTIVNILLPGADTPVSLLTGHIRGMNPPALYVAPIRPRWSPRIGDLLQKSFELSDAEIDTLRAFIETGSVAGVAADRARSIRTVRTQLSRVFAQMGISGQTELALFLATLGGLEASVAMPEDRDDRSRGKIQSQVFDLNGHETEVLRYGDPGGTPILLLQSTHPPGLTEALRTALHSQGLDIIAPLKPGSGQSAHIKKRPGPKEMAPLFAALMEELSLKRVLVAGQASGGLYALELARQFPDLVSGVALIDTGVPFEGRSALMALPKATRRTMVPARFFPDLLYLPHRLVAANFRRSAKGEASVVDYFFADSPEENSLTRTDASAYEVTRDIIRYSFEDTDRLVDDVSRWAKDWSELINSVAAKTTVTFLHGTSNQMFRVSAIERWLAPRSNARLFELGPGGQLAAFQNPKATAQGLKEAVRSS